MKSRQNFFTPEKGLLFLTFLLCVIGLLFVFEASVAEAFTSFGNQFYFVKQQAMGLVVGIIALLVGIFTPTQIWKKFSGIFYVVSIVLLIAVFLPGIGKQVNGAHRWINLIHGSFQPVELVKFSMIVFFATWMEKHQKLPPFLFLTLLPVALLLKQPDLGSALIVLVIAFTLFYLAGAPNKIFVIICGAGIALLMLTIILAPYRMKRITTFLNPDADPLGASFHIHQITIALGNGGWFGQGIGKSRQKFSYIPEASTDSIFAIIAEEVGFVGSLVIFALFFLFIHLGYLITLKTEQGSFDHLLAAGILIWISMQILLNLSAIVALVPLTGIPLPFFSFGGTALVMVLWITGILIRIGRVGTRKENTK